MVDGLGKVKRSAKVQLTVGHGNETRRWHLALSRTGSKLSEGPVERPDLEIEAADDVWLEILGGEVSPLEAFGQGRLKVRGDLELGRVIARALKSS
jgi:putative sterol carrier protein